MVVELIKSQVERRGQDEEEWAEVSTAWKLG